MTPFPTADDYIRAVQDRHNFLAPALQRAAFDLDPVWQIPRPASGNAAVVFKATVDGNAEALRFFIRDDASSRDRYNALGRYVAEQALESCVARAEWIDDAIVIRDRRWPLVQMQWVDGRTMGSYVEHLVERNDAAALAALATAWRQLIDRMQRARFAHGDLQHANVLIDRAGQLRLVDFDGSWIVPFYGKAPPHENGHPNYQPSGRVWGQWMDTFPGLVIYLAVLVLSRQPACWAALSTGENMLFTPDDFRPPFRTRTWQALAALGDPEVDRLAAVLRRCCSPGWVAGGPLEELLTVRPVEWWNRGPAGIPARAVGPGQPLVPGPGAPAADPLVPPPDLHHQPDVLPEPATVPDPFDLPRPPWFPPPPAVPPAPDRQPARVLVPALVLGLAAAVVGYLLTYMAADDDATAATAAGVAFVVVTLLVAAVRRNRQHPGPPR